MKSLRISTILFCLFYQVSFAQNYVDLAKFDYAQSSVNTFDTGTAITGLMEMNGDLTAPIVLNEKLTILTGVTYERTTAVFYPWGEEESLTGLTLKLGMNVNHNSKFSATYMLLPKISSNMKNINSNDFQLGAVVLMKYEKNDHFNYKFGVYGNEELFGPFIVPIFGFYYQNPTDKLEVKVLLPLSADVNYATSSNARLGFSFRGQIRTYNLNDQGLWGPPRLNPYVARATNEIYTYFQYGLENGVNVQLGVGRSIGRSYRIYNEKVNLGMPLAYFGDNRTQLNTDFSDSWLYKVTLFYRLNLNQQPK